MASPGFDGLTDSIVGAFLGDVYLRDYQHAAKVFLPNTQSNAPKVKFMFHTYFNINAEAWTPPFGLGLENYGVLVKSIKLPAFQFDVTELNQYNRKRIIQSKIKYDPIDVVFHDDNASQITAMWNAYYQYYYADSWNPQVLQFTNSASLRNYNRRNIYDGSLTGDLQYGYRGDSFEANKERPSFFKDITIYGLWANNYIAYTLINPIITSFVHDTYDYDQGGATMTNRMQINYETVTYNTGQLGIDRPDDAVVGFQDEAAYDLTPSANNINGTNTIGNAVQLLMAVFTDPNASLFERIQAAAQFAQLDPEVIIANTSAAIYNGLRQAVLDFLSGNSGGDSGFPTALTSPAMINIANQGGVTGANNGGNSGERTAGEQFFGDLVDKLTRGFGF